MSKDERTISSQSGMTEVTIRIIARGIRGLTNRRRGEFGFPSPPPIRCPKLRKHFALRGGVVDESYLLRGDCGLARARSLGPRWPLPPANSFRRFPNGSSQPRQG